MCLGFQRDNRLDRPQPEEIRLIMCGRCKLHHLWALNKCTIVFVCGNHPVVISAGSISDHLEQGELLLHTINNKVSVKDFVPAMLRIHLRKTEDFTVGKFSANLLCQTP